MPVRPTAAFGVHPKSSQSLMLELGGKLSGVEQVADIGNATEGREYPELYRREAALPVTTGPGIEAAHEISRHCACSLHAPDTGVAPKSTGRDPGNTSRAARHGGAATPMLAARIAVKLAITALFCMVADVFMSVETRTGSWEVAAQHPA